MAEKGQRIEAGGSDSLIFRGEGGLALLQSPEYFGWLELRWEDTQIFLQKHTARAAA